MNLPNVQSHLVFPQLLCLVVELLEVFIDFRTLKLLWRHALPPLCSILRHWRPMRVALVANFEHLLNVEEPVDHVHSVCFVTNFLHLLVYHCITMQPRFLRITALAQASCSLLALRVSRRVE